MNNSTPNAKPRRKKREPVLSNVINFPVPDDHEVRRMTNPTLAEAFFVRMPGGWQVVRPDGSLFGYLIQVIEEAA